MKFSSCPRRRPGFSPYPNVALALPFDPSLGVADPNNAAALPGITMNADATLARTNDAAARSCIPKHTITVRRIGTINAGDSWACRDVRRRRISRNLPREGETYQQKNENEAGADGCLHCPTPVLHVTRA